MFLLLSFALCGQGWANELLFPDASSSKQAPRSPKSPQSSQKKASTAVGADDTAMDRAIVLLDGPNPEHHCTTVMEIYTSAASHNSSRAQYNLGYLYENGVCVAKDTKESMSWFMSAAKQGDSDAMNMVGWKYAWGVGVQQNAAEARRWLEQASNGGSVKANLSLGTLMLQGENGFPRDHSLAKSYLERATAGGLIIAKVFLADLYSNGWGVPRDVPKALELVRSAAEQGEPLGQQRLAWYCLNGMGLAKDFGMAYFWASLAQQGKLIESVHRDVQDIRNQAMKQLTSEEIARQDAQVIRWRPSK